MSEGLTCYEQDEELCSDEMCLRTGCRLRNDRLRTKQQIPARIWATEFENRVELWTTEPNTYQYVFIRADLAERMAEALAGVVRASESGRDTIGFMIDLQRAAVECAAALSAFRSATQGTEAVNHD